MEGGKLGWDLPTVTGKILKYAVLHIDEFKEPLENPMPLGGEDITIKMPFNVKKHFKAWAKESKRNQPQHAAFILEKYLEKESFKELVKIDAPLFI